MRFSGRPGPWLGALHGLPGRCLTPSCLRSCPRRYQEQHHGARVQERRHDEHEPPQHVPVGLAEQGGKIFHRPEVSLDGATLVIRLLKRRLLREGRRCGRPRPERPS